MCAYVRTRIKEFKPARNAVFAILCCFREQKSQNKTIYLCIDYFLLK